MEGQNSKSSASFPWWFRDVNAQTELHRDAAYCRLYIGWTDSRSECRVVKVQFIVCFCHCLHARLLNESQQLDFKLASFLVSHVSLSAQRCRRKNAEM